MNEKELFDWKIVAANVPEPGTLMNLANLLPHGWTMQIDMQQGAGGVSLFGPFDDLYEPDTGKGLEADMVQAVRFAHFREAEQDHAVNGAWRRFLDAMVNNMTPNVELSGLRGF